MGLDMYLYQEAYISEYVVSAPSKVEKEDILPFIQELQDKLGIHGSVTKIRVRVGQWRKANAIHQWFVNNVQDGQDDCGDYWVSGDTLEELHGLCKELISKLELEDGEIHVSTILRGSGPEKQYRPGKVVTNPEVADELLPSTDGFFFGSTSYDEFYIQDLEHTVDIIDSLRDNDGNLSGDYYYTSSW